MKKAQVGNVAPETCNLILICGKVVEEDRKLVGDFQKTWDQP